MRILSYFSCFLILFLLCPVIATAQDNNKSYLDKLDAKRSELELIKLDVAIAKQLQLLKQAQLYTTLPASMGNIKNLRVPASNSENNLPENKQSSLPLVISIQGTGNRLSATLVLKSGERITVVEGDTIHEAGTVTSISMKKVILDNQILSFIR